MVSTVVSIETVGLLDAGAGDHLRDQVVAALKGGASAVALDCRAITLMDSNGFSALVVCLKKTRESSTPFVLVAPTAQMNLVLEMTGTDQIFTIVADTEDLEAHLSAPGA